MDFTGNVIRFETIDSTNRFLASEALRGAPEGTVCVADYQTSGRGRAKRTWESPPLGGLLASVLFRPEIPMRQIHLIPAMTALAILDASEKVSDVRCGIKWPNDIVYRDKKLGGMLSEMINSANSDGGMHPVLVVGFGINCAWPKDFQIEEEKAIALPPTTLAEITGRSPDKNALLEAILRNIQTRYAQLVSSLVSDKVDGIKDSGGTVPEESGHRTDTAFHTTAESITREYRSRCVTLGKNIKVIFRDKTLYGRAMDIDESGRLVVTTEGQTITVDAADIVHLRQSD
ncbi:MAG: biotin--[acetyl-CoA-carboxylase] ligase [Firmicutes bacterium]|nr:biotin--[acetyl-CoA-carboxylase] ligase [Bacillota bacterium]